MIENPGAYNESRNRLREEKEREKKMLENLTERFEKEKNLIKIEKKFDVFRLRHSLETLHSLSELKEEMRQALKEGVISRESFDHLQEQIQISEKTEKNDEIAVFANENFPF